MECKVHYFYVLLCKDGTFYGGYTTDLARRLNEHNQGIGAKYTKLSKRRPLQMIHAECFSTRSEAQKAEYAFKQLTRRQKETYLRTHPSVTLPNGK
ncbi:GIY-YIG nuclease family protein [Enterococcus cecorum]|uniref:GIY-YIG nuclease family protein n=1 Tax=Enterococcus cecorum TaxID=44008 RepID=UPI000E017589|nr:GIY-YIG nuclease family protein [Enterococcus cecorum]CAI3346373.1 GIY-YIG nuclease family protein [Enterococcus cecorum]STP86685.1 GIY-YIG nuclease superfamily protein [Enterococcus cecorum]